MVRIRWDAVGRLGVGYVVCAYVSYIIQTIVLNNASVQWHTRSRDESQQQGYSQHYIIVYSLDRHLLAGLHYRFLYTPSPCDTHDII